MNDKSCESSIKNIVELGQWVADNSAKISIPNLQRDYVWGEKEWERLWMDILDVYYKWEKNKEERSAQHFIGILTLKEINENPGCFEVLDGQQRLTTLSIILDCLLDYNNYINKTTNNLINGIGFEIDGIHVGKYDVILEYLEGEKPKEEKEKKP